MSLKRKQARTELAKYDINHVYTPSEVTNLPSIEQLDKLISSLDKAIDNCSSGLEEHRKAFMSYSTAIQDHGRKIKTIRDVTEFVRHSNFIENNTCNVDPQLTVTFLKKLRKLLRENRGNEDVVLNDLLELAADHGLSIPSILTDENVANADTQSLNSLNTIQSEMESEQGVVWESIKQHLKLCLFEKLRQLPIVNVNENMPNMSFISQRRQHYLGSLLMLLDKGEVLEQYQRIRWWQMKHVIDSINTNPSVLPISEAQSGQQTQIAKLKFYFDHVTNCTHEDAAVLMPLLNQHEDLIDWYIRTTYVEKSLNDVHDWLQHSLNGYLNSTEQTAMDFDDLELICDIYAIVSQSVKTITDMLELCAAADKQSHQKLLLSAGSASKLESPTTILSRVFKPYVQLMAQALIHYSNITIEQATQAESHLTWDNMTVTVNATYNLDSHHQPKVIFKGCASLFKIWDKFLPILTNDYGKIYTSLKVVIVDVICQKAIADMSPSPAYLAIATAAFIKNRLLTFDQILSTDTRLSFFTSYEHYADLVESLCELIVEHHNTTISTTVLQDSDSNNYSNPRTFYEGKRCSFSIQMWNYYLHSIRHDLWQYCPLKQAQRIFISVLENSLLTLSFRYGQIKPSLRRLCQFRADINAIILISLSFIWFTGQTVNSLVNPDFHALSTADFNPQSEIPKIYNYCNLLLMIVVAESCPIDVYPKAISRFQDGSKISGSNNICGTFWLSNYLPDMFSSIELSDIPPQVSLKIAIKLLRHRTGIDLKLILQILLSNKFSALKLIITETDTAELYKSAIEFTPHHDDTDDAMSESSDMSVEPSNDLQDSFIDCLLSVLIILDSHCRSRAVHEVLTRIVEKEYTGCEALTIFLANGCLNLVLLESLHIALRSLADNLPSMPVNILEFQAFLKGYYQQFQNDQQLVENDKLGLKVIRYCIHNFLMQFAVDNPKFDDTKCQLFASCFLHILNFNNQDMVNRTLAVEFPYIDLNLQTLEEDIIRIKNFFDGKVKSEKVYDIGNNFQDDLFLASIIESIDFDVTVVTQIRTVHEFLISKLEMLENKLQMKSEDSNSEFYEHLSERFNPFFYYDHIKDWGKFNYNKLTNYKHDWETLLQYVFHLPHNTIKKLLSARPELEEDSLDDDGKMACKTIREFLTTLSQDSDRSKHNKKK
ncbi:uncharacterized protein TRIADDRAFT_54178 [Trichoplax adhaerens]|uniref:Uncharacterized protein n=1 Tax=Trichoplax adhaerens TaxID=10228 RepID=B3RRB8_TRIAD|nr:hypothetical protein TRIADDRAFT_54178 [Trichoplax adhaerens]EDV26315.1 hypothetical protein TRIADDRAFT_54178 [Trichoplax adhaerens]|eukprot:XP_002110311.1 hypothetical protein TRIADDRAFT_54178 [Trichoplax adhaerens]